MHQLIFCTCPDQQIAKRIAECLVRDKFAACVNIVPGITSIYEWQGKIESTQEHLLITKVSEFILAK
jgi:periplasmic divalent cation tolerance protein